MSLPRRGWNPVFVTALPVPLFFMQRGPAEAQRMWAQVQPATALARGILDRRSLHRMRCEVLVETRHYFSHRSLHVSIERRNHSGHVFSIYWFIVRVVVRPYRSTGIEVAHLEFQRHSG